MNIVFFHGNEILPESGGMPRITYTLGELFQKSGHNVWYLGAKHKNQAKYLDNQVFLPDEKTLITKNNVEFLCIFLNQNKIDIVVNQVGNIRDYTLLLVKSREKSSLSFKIVSCFHNCILNQIYNFAYYKEYLLKKRKIDIIFKILSYKAINKLLVKCYILRNRNTIRYIYKNNDAIVLLDEGHLQEFKIMSGLKNVDKLSCIPNCIEVEQNEELPKKENLVIWAGNFDYYIKRPDYMLKIWSLLQNEHKNWRLFMLGDGPSFEDIKEEADQLKLERVEFKGRINPYPYYKMGKIICVTSIFESFSLVTLEGMANYSVPFAFNSFSMASTLIEDGVNGYLVDPFSIQTYANKLGYLMENEDLRNKMSAIACEKSKKYDSKNIYLMWNTLFKNLFV